MRAISFGSWGLRFMFLVCYIDFAGTFGNCFKRTCRSLAVLNSTPLGRVCWQPFVVRVTDDCASRHETAYMDSFTCTHALAYSNRCFSGFGMGDLFLFEENLDPPLMLKILKQHLLQSATLPSRPVVVPAGQ